MIIFKLFSLPLKVLFNWVPAHFPGPAPPLPPHPISASVFQTQGLLECSRGVWLVTSLCSPVCCFPCLECPSPFPKTHLKTSPSGFYCWGTVPFAIFCAHIMPSAFSKVCISLHFNCWFTAVFFLLLEYLWCITSTRSIRNTQGMFDEWMNEWWMDKWMRFYFN